MNSVYVAVPQWHANAFIGAKDVGNITLPTLTLTISSVSQGIMHTDQQCNTYAEADIVRRSYCLVLVRPWHVHQHCPSQACCKRYDM